MSSTTVAVHTTPFISGAGHLADALAERGAAPALKTINLFQNQIGDEGARRLADALAAASAAPALKKLELSSNPASDDAKQAVKDAVNQRKPTE